MDLKNGQEDGSEQFDVVLEDVETGIRPRKLKVEDKKKRSTGNGWQFVGLAGGIGFDVVLPMVIGLLVGTKLDEYWGTRPKATLLLFLGGLGLSCASLIRIVREMSVKR